MLLQRFLSPIASVAISYGRLPLAKLYFRLCHFCFWNKGKTFHCSLVAAIMCQQPRLPFSIRHHLLQILREFTYHMVNNESSSLPFFGELDGPNSSYDRKETHELRYQMKKTCHDTKETEPTLWTSHTKGLPRRSGPALGPKTKALRAQLWCGQLPNLKFRFLPGWTCAKVLDKGGLGTSGAAWDRLPASSSLLITSKSEAWTNSGSTQVSCLYHFLNRKWRGDSSPRIGEFAQGSPMDCSMNSLSVRGDTSTGVHGNAVSSFSSSTRAIEAGALGTSQELWAPVEGPGDGERRSKVCHSEMRWFNSGESKTLTSLALGTRSGVQGLGECMSSSEATATASSHSALYACSISSICWAIVASSAHGRRRFIKVRRAATTCSGGWGCLRWNLIHASFSTPKPVRNAAQSYASSRRQTNWTQSNKLSSPCCRENTCQCQSTNMNKQHPGQHSRRCHYLKRLQKVQ